MQETILPNGMACVRKGNALRTLVFISNASGSAFTWDKQMNDPRFDAYSRVYIDYPGHGKSAFSERPETDYTIPGMGARLLEAITALELTEYILVTASLGGNVVAEIADTLAECRGFFITGGSVIGGDILPQHVMLPFEYGGPLFEEKPSEEDLQGYISGLVFRQEKAVLDGLTDAYRRTDPRFRSCFAASLGLGQWSDEIGKLAATGKPVAFVYGAQEKIIDPGYMEKIPGINKWRNRVYLLQEAGHFPHLDQPEIFAELLFEFVKEVTAPPYTDNRKS